MTELLEFHEEKHHGGTKRGPFLFIQESPPKEEGEDDETEGETEDPVGESVEHVEEDKLDTEETGELGEEGQDQDNGRGSVNDQIKIKMINNLRCNYSKTFYPYSQMRRT